MIMNGKYLLDTNTVISFMRKDKKTVEAIHELEEVFIPVTVVGELYYGAFKSKKIKENLKNISELLKIISVLGNDVKTARIYGDLKNKLKEKGRPIPENDIWIASIAKQYKLTIITADQHFEAIENLKLVVP
jgi:tRNA(fMet)-specific endonuclease VapC